MYPGTYDSSRLSHSERWKKVPQEEYFRCGQCGAAVYTNFVISGVQNRNHCPFCLSSRHVDHAQAGDRLSACKSIMLPIGLTVKPGRNKYRRESNGEIMLIHRCNQCGKISINRLAADDEVERLMEIFYVSMGMDGYQVDLLEKSGIRMLTLNDSRLVERQLIGLRKI